MTVVVRFAPSPTGLLHAGNIRVALLNWLFAKSQGGQFVLRLDDTDLERSEARFEAAIEEDLTWLGLKWDRKENQAKRLRIYAQAQAQLLQMGRLYPCYETPDELDFKRKLQLSRKKPPVYDRSALKLTPEDRAKFEAEGRKPHWRFLLDHKEVRWDDLVHGPCHYDCASLSDPVLIRADGTPLYTLPSILDDIEFGITHIIRGEDHLTNTAVQIQLFEALGAKPPIFAHLPLMVGSDGEGLSKRTGALSIRELREEGFVPLAINSLLAQLGTAGAIDLKPSLEELIAGFAFNKFSRASARFDMHELLHLNAKFLHNASFGEISGMLRDSALTSELWEGIKTNLERLKDLAPWIAVVKGEISPVINDPAFIAQALELLPAEPWDKETWKNWSGLVKDKSGRKGKELFLPLRLAITGLDHGPEMRDLLPLIGRERVLSRLKGN